jgi:hypothetical protein
VERRAGQTDLDVIIETLEGLGLAVSADDAWVTSFSCQGSVANSFIGRLTTVFGPELAPNHSQLRFGRLLHGLVVPP